VWTGVMMAGADIGALVLLPVMQELGLLRLPTLGWSIAQAEHLYLWSLAIALSSPVVGAWAWNAASQRLPMVLSGQLIALESLFATLLGLAFHGRLPTPLEAAGLAAVLVGVVMAVRILLTPIPFSTVTPEKPRHLKDHHPLPNRHLADHHQHDHEQWLQIKLPKLP
jgi:drug/metabolite transporter (DMT)-like permease